MRAWGGAAIVREISHVAELEPSRLAPRAPAVGLGGACRQLRRVAPGWRPKLTTAPAIDAHAAAAAIAAAAAQPAVPAVPAVATAENDL